MKNVFIWSLPVLIPLNVNFGLVIPENPQKEAQWFYDEVYRQIKTGKMLSINFPVFSEDPSKNDRFPAYNLVLSESGEILSGGANYLPDPSWEDTIVYSLLKSKFSPNSFRGEKVKSLRAIYLTHYLYLSSEPEGDVQLPIAQWNFDRSLFRKLRTWVELSGDGQDGEIRITFHVDKDGSAKKATSRSNLGSHLVKIYIKPNLEQFNFAPILKEGKPDDCKVILRIGKGAYRGEGFKDISERDFFPFEGKTLHDLPDEFVDRDFIFVVDWTPSGRIESVIPLTKNTPGELSNAVFSNLIYWKSKAFVEKETKANYFELIRFKLDAGKSLSLDKAGRKIYRIEEAVRIAGDPPRLRNQSLGGNVTLRVTIDKNGEISDFKILFPRYSTTQSPTAIDRRANIPIPWIPDLLISQEGAGAFVGKGTFSIERMQSNLTRSLF